MEKPFAIYADDENLMRKVVNSAEFRKTLLHMLSVCLDGGGEEAELGASSHRLLRVRGLGPGVRLTGQHSI